ncbi:hypothetical protein TW95_gp0819 [Pandoravirus inopinatum]|uniref:Uncharacterized protein n=1 Tax=Pandoravirus inopinatum TaxID=1605721 RepID=A0A0B5IXN9_9VIRU|nr:hypothetical protein TW95_gp0819 [Pandoravirus inopinatum]AJF97553.1 hypothetical protein [Pandoravirus inopinatum]
MRHIVDAIMVVAFDMGPRPFERSRWRCAVVVIAGTMVNTYCNLAVLLSVGALLYHDARKKRSFLRSPFYLKVGNDGAPPIWCEQKKKKDLAYPQICIGAFGITSTASMGPIFFL